MPMLLLEKYPLKIWSLEMFLTEKSRGAVKVGVSESERERTWEKRRSKNMKCAQVFFVSN